MSPADWIGAPTVSAHLWALIILCGLGTWLLRASFITLAGGRALPRWMTRALRYVPPAVLAAIVVPALLQANALFTPDWDWTRTAAGAVAAAVALWTRRIVMTLVVGMAALWTFMALG